MTSLYNIRKVEVSGRKIRVFVATSETETVMHEFESKDSAEWLLKRALTNIHQGTLAAARPMGAA